MAGSEMIVDTAAVRASARSIDDAAQQLAGDVGALEQTVTTNNPWGADEPGTLFGAAYGEVLGHALATLGSHVQLLGSAAQGLAAWADDVTVTEDAGTAGFHRIADAL